MGVWADEGWSFICGLKKLPHPACPSSSLSVTGGKPGLLCRIKYSYFYLDVCALFEMWFCFEAILAAGCSVCFGEDWSPSGSAA